MRDFNQSNRGGRHGGNRGGSRFNDFRGGDRQMHHAVCASCGKDCQVPFRPTGDKPVYCNDCFANRDNGNNRQSFGHNSNPHGERTFRGGGDYSRQSSPNCKRDFDVINHKLDILIQTVTALKPAQSKASKPKKTKKSEVTELIDTPEVLIQEPTSQE